MGEVVGDGHVVVELGFEREDLVLQLPNESRLVRELVPPALETLVAKFPLLLHALPQGGELQGVREACGRDHVLT